jgi:hypothetical protein
MISFLEFVKNKVDASQIIRVYDKASIAIDLVNWYRPDLLDNISTVADLGSGAYGLYNSAENLKESPPDIQQRLIYFGKVSKRNLDSLPKKIINQYFPDVDARKIKSKDTIRVNIRRILRESEGDLEKVFRIASVVIHECVHEMERESQGWTNESGPRAEQEKFKAWANQNLAAIIKKYPGLTPLDGIQTPLGRF